jgi:hypothetical protein
MAAKDEIAISDENVRMNTEGLGQSIDRTKYVPGNESEFFANGYNDVYYEDIDFSRAELGDKPNTLFDRLYNFFTRAEKVTS